MKKIIVALFCALAVTSAPLYAQGQAADEMAAMARSIKAQVRYELAVAIPLVPQ